MLCGPGTVTVPGPFQSQRLFKGQSCFQDQGGLRQSRFYGALRQHLARHTVALLIIGVVQFQRPFEST